MTTRVVWLCRHCNQPITFTCAVDRLGPGEYRVHAAPHIHAHRIQHQ